MNLLLSKEVVTQILPGIKTNGNQEPKRAVAWSERGLRLGILKEEEK